MDKLHDDEIDLFSVFQNLWDGKWKIALITAVSVLSVLGYNILIPNKTFIAQTKIKPITSSEFDKYLMFNASLKKIKKIKINKETDVKESITNIIFEITPETLMNLYIEKLEEGTLLEKGIDKFELFNKDDFENEKDYKEAIQKFASQIQILKQQNKEKGEINLNHVLRAKYDDEDKWKDLLTFVNNEVNRKVKANIIYRFENIISVEEQAKNFAIKDLDIAIENARQDYHKNMIKKLAFLYEQASIARKLNIDKNTISTQRFNAQNSFVTSVQTDRPFYLRGYVAIEEEIYQIKNRKDVSSFIQNSFKLQNQKRDLMQDKTLQRARDSFLNTPVNQTDFRATLVKVAVTDFELIKKRNLYYALAIILGGIIGVVYVLISNALKTRAKIESNL